MTNKINTNGAQTLVAIDQHAKTSTLYALDTTTGEIKSKRFSNCPSYVDFIDWLNTVYCQVFFDKICSRFSTLSAFACKTLSKFTLPQLYCLT